MLSEQVSQEMLSLPVEDRLELARRLVESVVLPASLNDAVSAGIKRIEDVASGRVAGLTESEFWAALG